MLKRKEMGHVSKFQFRDVCIQSKEHRICVQINISPFSTHISTLIILSKNKLKKIHVQVTQYL